jgi:hypothetical protein
MTSHTIGSLAVTTPPQCGSQKIASVLIRAKDSGPTNRWVHSPMRETCSNSGTESIGGRSLRPPMKRERETQVLGMWSTGHSKLLTMPRSVAAPAAIAA